jgi:hypothetical protein
MDVHLIAKYKIYILVQVIQVFLLFVHSPVVIIFTNLYTNKNVTMETLFWSMVVQIIAKLPLIGIVQIYRIILQFAHIFLTAEMDLRLLQFHRVVMMATL